MASSPEEHESKPVVNAPTQVRSRITVVCAECKRLKLKCDRAVPACSSCKKRGTVARCVYSPKAFEKLDLHSLHNRLARVEASLAQLTTTPAAPVLHHRSGPALTLSLTELSQVWLDTCDIDFVPGGAGSTTAHSPAYAQPTLFLPPLNVYFVQQHSSEPTSASNPQVTPELLKVLPNPKETYLSFLANAESTMRLRPSFEWSRLRTCAERLIVSIDTSTQSLAAVHGDEDASTQHSAHNVNFFAATCSALAIGALSHECIGSEQPDEFLREANFLHALSQQALSVAEMHQVEQAPESDLDFIVACILQITYALRSGLIHSSRMNSCRKSMGLIGKMINIARQLSLNIDPQDIGSFGDMESENRRRLWWQVVWFDTYVSDIMGHPPLIADNSFTTKLPHDGKGYFGLSCCLVRLVRKMLAFTDITKGSISGSRTYTLEEVTRFEADVNQLIEGLPHALNPNSDLCGCDGFGDLDQSAVMAQQCEITIMAQKLIIRAYFPFLLSPHPPGSDSHDGNANQTPKWVPPHQATLATVTAAHTIVETCKKLYAIWQDVSAAPSGGKPNGSHVPALFDLYTLSRSMFDAGIICAHAAIHQPITIWSKVALEGVRDACVYIKDDTSLIGWMHELSHGDAVQLLEKLRDRAEAAISGELANGLKRKSNAVDEPGTLGSASGPRKSPSIERSNVANGMEDAQKTPRPPGEYPSVGFRIRANSKLPSSASLSPKLSNSRRRASSSTTDPSRSQSRTQIPPLHAPGGPLNAPSTSTGLSPHSGLRSNASSNQASPIMHPSRNFQPSPLLIHPSDIIPNLPFAKGVMVDPNAPLRGKGYQLWLNACYEAYRQGLLQPEYAGSQYEDHTIYNGDRSPGAQFCTIPLGTFPYPQPSLSPLPVNEGGPYPFPPPKDTIPPLSRAEPSAQQQNVFTETQSYYHHYPTQPSFEGLSSPGQQQQIHSNMGSLLGLGLQGLGSSSTMEVPSSASAAPSIYDDDLRPSAPTIDTMPISHQPSMIQNGNAHITPQPWGTEEYRETPNQNAINSGHYWPPQQSPDFQYFQR